MDLALDCAARWQGIALSLCAAARPNTQSEPMQDVLRTQREIEAQHQDS